MALTVTSIANALFKKLQGKSSSNDGRQFFEEPRDARGAVFLSQIVAQSDLIPTTAPGGADQVVTGVLKRWIDLVLTPVPGVANAFFSDNLKGCIPFNFGDGSYNYGLKDSAGAAIPFGQGDWLVDTDTGTLTFYGTVPANMPPQISFYQYVGTFGAIGSNPPYLQLSRQATVPATPPSGFDRIYVDSTGKPLKVDPTGAIKSLGGGGGGASGKNYLADFYDGTSVTGINTFNNTVSYIVPSGGNPVDLLGDAINLTGHLFATGQAVFYLAGSAAIGGLVPSTIYYAVRINANVFGLALTQADAIAKKLIDLTSQGTGNQTFNSSGTGVLLGTGGTVAGVTTTINTSSPLRAPSNQRLSKDAAMRINSGWSIDLTLDRADVDGGRPMKIAGKLRTSANYVSNALNTDLQITLYDVTNNLPLALDGAYVQAIPVATTATGFAFQFNPNFAGYNVRMVISVGTSSTLALDLDLIDLELSSAAGSVPGVFASPLRLVGPIPTPTVLSGVAPTKGVTTVDRYMAGRHMDYLHLALQYNQAAGTAGTATSDVFYTLPNNLQFDPARTTFNTQVYNNGAALFVTTGAFLAGSINDTQSQGIVAIVPYDATRYRLGINWNAGTGGVGRGFQGGSAWNYGTAFSMELDVLLPVLGWDAGPTYSTSEIALKNTPQSTASPLYQGGNTWNATTGNSLTLQPGTYDLTGSIFFRNNGTFPGYTVCRHGWFAANGTNTTTTPALLTTLPGLTAYGLDPVNNPYNQHSVANLGDYFEPVFGLTVKVTQPTTIYYVGQCEGSAIANSRIAMVLTANKRPDYSAFGVYGQVDIRSVVSPETAPFNAAWTAFANSTIPLPVGTWKVTGSLWWYNNGTSPQYNNMAMNVFGAGGTNTATRPALLGSLPNVIMLAGGTTTAPGYIGGGSAVVADGGGHDKTYIIRVTSGTATVGVSGYFAAAAPGNARAQAYLTAEKLQ